MKFRYSGFILHSCALLAVVSVALSALGSQEFLVGSWQVEDGLPEGNSTAIQQTPDGYLWVGTPKGLARFDGARFRVFNTRNTPVIRDERISDLLVDREGILWIVCENGELVQHANGKFQHVRLPL